MADELPKPESPKPASSVAPDWNEYIKRLQGQPKPPTEKE